jgi:transcriptional regulator with XRE-family HTH domain
VLSAATLIRRTRQAAGLTQAELARRANVSQPVIARLEREGANPRLTTLDRVIAAAGRQLELTTAPSHGIDLIVEDLKLTPDERLRAFESLYDFAREFGGAALRGS